MKLITGLNLELRNKNKLSDFLRPGVPENAAKRSFLQYEEQRKLKLKMVNELQKEIERSERDSRGNYLDPNNVYKPKK